MIDFHIDDWRAWAPGLEQPDDWRAWATTGRGTPAATAAAHPDVSFLPAMQRRRLSPLARMTFKVCWPLAEGRGELPLVFCSRHGETPQTSLMLGDLAREEPLSPTQFSLSVHNAIIGQWSIARGDTREMTALAAEGDGFECALLEAAALLEAGAPEVLLVVAEDVPPSIYREAIDDIPFAYALALRLKAGAQWHLQLQAAPDTDAAPNPAELPNALDFLRQWLRGATHCQHRCKRRLWTWRRLH